jgi:hypothetical protein
MTIASGSSRLWLLPGVIAAGCAIGLVAAAGSEALDPAVLSAGIFTTPESGAAAFSIPVATLDIEQAEAFAKGKEQFNEAWVLAPDPSGVWGLGPTFNEDRCAHCHVNNGRAAAPADGQPALSPPARNLDQPLMPPVPSRDATGHWQPTTESAPGGHRNGRLFVGAGIAAAAEFSMLPHRSGSCPSAREE